MSTNCPSAPRLLLAALAPDGTSADPLITVHVRSCDSCQKEIAELRATAAALRASAATAATPAAGACLSELTMARLLDGARSDESDQAVGHLTACPRCRAQLASLARLFDEPAIAAEVQGLAAPAPVAHRRSRLTIAGGVAAAAVAGILLWSDVAPFGEPELAGTGDDYRERTLTTTAAPRILGPIGSALLGDSLRWSSVPGADLYRITVWRTDGTVAWTGEVRDTVVPLPDDLTNYGSDELLWDVRARTGWDRWVASDLVQFTLGSPARRAK